MHIFGAQGNTYGMLTIFLRSLVAYFLLLSVMRLMGKRQLGEMQPFELVITLLIAELACTPMADISIPFLYGVAPVLALFMIHQLISVIEHAGAFAKRTLSGKPSLIIGKDGLDYKELKRNNLDVSDVMEALRVQGYFSLTDVSYAVLEANGNFSFLPAKQPTSLPEQGEPALSLLLVSGGKLDHNNLKLLGYNEKFVQKLLRSQKVRSLKNVLCLTIDPNGNCYLQEKNRPGCSFHTNTENAVW